MAQSGRKSFVDWYFEAYRESLGLQKIEGGSRFKALLAGFDPGTPGRRVLSGILRMQAFAILKYGYPLDHTGYTCAVFRAQTPDAETHYAYVYWQGEDFERPEYICLSPTFDSRDGEYRENFILYDDFEQHYDGLLSAFSPAEEQLEKMVYRDALGLHMQVFPAENADKAVLNIDKLRLQMKALVVAWALSYGVRALHVNAAHVTVMDRLAKTLQRAHARWAKDMPSCLSAFRTGRPNNINRTRCGQKLIPLTIHEVTRPGDINFYPWREIYVLQICTELVMNFICPSFPMHNQWTYLEGASELLFENDAMHARYRRSDAARSIIARLRDARTLTRGSEGGVPDGYVLGQLDAHVYGSIEYAQSFAALTDTVLCTTSERVGLTFHTIPAKIRCAPYVAPDYEALFEDVDLFAKYLYDLVYGAHVLQSRGGAIHTDLHLNNLTLYETDTAYDPITPGTTSPKHRLLYKDPLIAYVGLRGEADTYVFPARNRYACLIDFSRSILGGAAIERMDADFGTSWATAFCRDQTNRMLRAFHRYAPELVEKNQEKLKGIILASPTAAFRALAAVDFLAIGRNLGVLLRELKKPRKQQPGELREVLVSKEVVNITARLEKAAQELYLTRLRGLLEQKSPRDGDEPWPGDELLPKVFRAYRYENWSPDRLRKGTLVDVWHYNNELRYSGRSYEQFPPWAKFEEIQRHLGGLELTDVLSRGQRPFVDALTAALGQGVEVVAEQVRVRETDEPAAATSSWIGE